MPEKYLLEQVLLTGEKLYKIGKQFMGKVCTFTYMHAAGCPVQSGGNKLNEEWYKTELIAGSVTIKRPFLDSEYIIIERTQSNVPGSPQGYVIEIKARNKKRLEKYKSGIEEILKE